MLIEEVMTFLRGMQVCLDDSSGGRLADKKMAGIQLWSDGSGTICRENSHILTFSDLKELDHIIKKG